MNRFLRFIRDEEGTAAVEYAVMLAMILLSVIGAITSVGTSNGGMWGNVGTKLTAVFSP